MKTNTSFQLSNNHPRSFSPSHYSSKALALTEIGWSSGPTALPPTNKSPNSPRHQTPTWTRASWRFDKKVIIGWSTQGPPIVAPTFPYYFHKNPFEVWEAYGKGATRLGIHGEIPNVVKAKCNLRCKHLGMITTFICHFDGEASPWIFC